MHRVSETRFPQLNPIVSISPAIQIQTRTIIWTEKLQDLRGILSQSTANKI
uniref:Uncharacterized protein n=1 Tax=Rhizophora mucronata TaxID=61149 RepID=A0A2P2QAL5_RHIMU